MQGLWATITKIQVLTDVETGNPILYCHGADRDHDPAIFIGADGGEIHLRCQTLFKIKANPQGLNRIDIYMNMDEAQIFADALAAAAGHVSAKNPSRSRANPNAARKGGMELPKILSSWYVRPARAEVASLCGLRMRTGGDYLNIDHEAAHETHIKMGEREVHLGLTLRPPSAKHDRTKTRLINVPYRELQRPKGKPRELNPVPMIQARVSIWISRGHALGMALLLASFPRSI